jgi:hypothetical protein
MENEKKIKTGLEAFLSIEDSTPKTEETTNEQVILTDKSIIERVNKKIIIEDGRQLLI